MSQKVTTGVRPTLRIADKNQIPATEPERQYYFMDIAKEYLRQLSEEKGNPLTFHVSTFGCQMNARDSEKLVGILEKIGLWRRTPRKRISSSIIPVLCARMPIIKCTEDWDI